MDELVSRPEQGGEQCDQPSLGAARDDDLFGFETLTMLPVVIRQYLPKAS
jgi:hypothetical protein